MLFRQSIPIAARREILFRLTNAGGGIVTGQTFSGSEIQVRKAGGSLANAANSVSVTEIGATGLYVYPASVGELDTPGSLLLRVNKTGAILFYEEHLVTPGFFGSVIAGTLTATAFSTDRTDATSHWKDALVTMLTGALAGQVKKIGAFANAAGLITLGTGLTFTTAPAATDVFELVTS